MTARDHRQRRLRPVERRPGAGGLAARGHGRSVEVALHEAVKSDFPFVTETSRHLVEAGGKRFRPLLVLLAAQFGDPAAPGVVPAAVVVELTHLATLYHDDVMDEAPLRAGRRRAPTPAGTTRWRSSPATSCSPGPRTSLADLGPEAVRLQARTFERLVHRADPRDGRARAGRSDPVEHYLRGPRRQDRLADRDLRPVRRACSPGADEAWSTC